MKDNGVRKWNSNITINARAYGFIPSDRIGFYKHSEKDITVDLTASGDDLDSVSKNIVKQILSKLA